MLFRASGAEDLGGDLMDQGFGLGAGGAFQGEFDVPAEGVFAFQIEMDQPGAVEFFVRCRGNDMACYCDGGFFGRHGVIHQGADRAGFVL